MGCTLAGGYYYLSHKPVGTFNHEERIRVQHKPYDNEGSISGDQHAYTYRNTKGGETAAASASTGMHVSVPEAELPPKHRS